MALMVKNLLASAREVKDTDQSLGQEDPLEEEMSTHSSILAWRIPCTERGATLHRSQRVRATEQLSNSTTVHTHYNN